MGSVPRATYKIADPIMTRTASMSPVHPRMYPISAGSCLSSTRRVRRLFIAARSPKARSSDNDMDTSMSTLCWASQNGALSRAVTSKHIQKHALFVRPKVAARPLGPLVADARESCERTKTSEGRDQEQRQDLGAWADVANRLDDEAFGNRDTKQVAELACEKEQAKILIPVKHPSQKAVAK